MSKENSILSFQQQKRERKFLKAFLQKPIFDLWEEKIHFFLKDKKF